MARKPFSVTCDRCGAEGPPYAIGFVGYDPACGREVCFECVASITKELVQEQDEVVCLDCATGGVATPEVPCGS